MKRSLLFWTIAVVLTLASAVYQRLTGPTHPFRGQATIAENTFKYKLPRTHVIGEQAAITIPAPSPDMNGLLNYRRHNSSDGWTAIPMQLQENQLSGILPQQSTGGKMQYFIQVTDKNSTLRIPSVSVIISRFRHAVPQSVLIPHIIVMFLAMLLSTRTGIEALKKNSPLTSWTYWTLLFIFVGGMIYGPLVQKYAFGAYWTGFPYGMDLTDNKTLIALLAWIMAAIRIRRNPQSRGWVIAAALVTLVAFLIPHSVMGTEIDYNKMPQP